MNTVTSPNYIYLQIQYAKDLAKDETKFNAGCDGSLPDAIK